MRKKVKIRFRDKTTQTFSLEEAEQILNTEKQLVMLYDQEGKWTGQTINKGEILGTERDFETERIETSKTGTKLLNEPILTRDRMRELLDKYKPL